MSSSVTTLAAASAFKRGLKKNSDGSASSAALQTQSLHTPGTTDFASVAMAAMAGMNRPRRSTSMPKGVAAPAPMTAAAQEESAEGGDKPSPGAKKWAAKLWAAVRRNGSDGAIVQSGGAPDAAAAAAASSDTLAAGKEASSAASKDPLPAAASTASVALSPGSPRKAEKQAPNEAEAAVPSAGPAAAASAAPAAPASGAAPAAAEPAVAAPAAAEPAAAEPAAAPGAAAASQGSGGPAAQAPAAAVASPPRGVAPPQRRSSTTQLKAAAAAAPGRALLSWLPSNTTRWTDEDTLAALDFAAAVDGLGAIAAAGGVRRGHSRVAPFAAASGASRASGSDDWDRLWAAGNAGSPSSSLHVPQQPSQPAAASTYRRRFSEVRGGDGSSPSRVLRVSTSLHSHVAAYPPSGGAGLGGRPRRSSEVRLSDARDSGGVISPRAPANPPPAASQTFRNRARRTSVTAVETLISVFTAGTSAGGRIGTAQHQPRVSAPAE